MHPGREPRLRMAGLAGFLRFPQCGPRGRAAKVWGGGSGPAGAALGPQGTLGQREAWMVWSPGSWDCFKVRSNISCQLPPTASFELLAWLRPVPSEKAPKALTSHLPPSEAGVWCQPTLREGLPTSADLSAPQQQEGCAFWLRHCWSERMICFHSGVCNSADRTGSGNGKDKWEINHPTWFSHNSKERVIAEPRSGLQSALQGPEMELSLLPTDLLSAPQEGLRAQRWGHAWSLLGAP